MNHILLRAYDRCERRKAVFARNRHRGLSGIAVDTDEYAREWQRLDRIAGKCYRHISTKLAAAESLAVALEAVWTQLPKAFSDETYDIYLDLWPKADAALRQWEAAR